MKWYHCDYCTQTQRFSRTCSQCGEESVEVEIERDGAQIALPAVGIPLLVAGIFGFLARGFAYEVVGENAACCTVLMVLYVLGLVSVVCVSIVGFFTAKNRVREKAEEDPVNAQTDDDWYEERTYETRRADPGQWNRRNRDRSRRGGRRRRYYDDGDPDDHDDSGYDHRRSGEGRGRAGKQRSRRRPPGRRRSRFDDQDEDDYGFDSDDWL